MQSPSSQTVKVPQLRAIVSRPISGSSRGLHETLLFTGEGIFPLLGLEGDAEGLRLGPALELTGSEPALAKMDSAEHAVYDRHSGKTVVAVSGGLVALEGSSCEWLAGDGNREAYKRDAVGRQAGIGTPTRVAAGRAGLIYLADDRTHLRQMDAALAVTSLTHASSTNPLVGLAYSGSIGGLVYTIGRKQLGKLLPLRAIETIAGSTDSSASLDGPAAAARFCDIRDLASDACGNVFILDGVLLRVLRADLSVATLGAPGVQHAPNRLTVLPDGRIAFYQYGYFSGVVQVVRLPPPGTAGLCGGDAGAGGHLDGLVADLDRLLGNADGTSDVAVLVGDCAFPAHRCILAARCPYFKQLFAGGFADSAAPEVTLEDAGDPDAFAAILRHLYTGRTDHLQQGCELLRPVAVLADRLLLAALSAHAQRQLLAAVTPASVAAELVWAEEARLEWLLARLEAYFAAHVQEVARQAPGSVDELLAGCSQPGLLKRLLLLQGGVPEVE
ncbi:BTB/POZ domain-containing protein 9 [Tetrabaena socialis]|uniref:BTB/POZ domain-containing protein 9 n=1 Tax=Tetrabaena socialis TaxID=47790 RepID=A0A2J8A9S3_9CHLO|nr:BTB/POZ domain-containing protein 9 [Tetrabaena socialis]|eukprot:PNH09272.1 BTB/POZ domain-containing protein 9 [Tetrabaena socialis]